MKYYSELLDRVFESVPELKGAERQFEAERTAKEKEEKELAKANALKAQSNAISKEKKELAKAITLASEKLDKAYQDYDIAKEEAQKILEESNKKMLAILTPAKDAIVTAQKERYKAVSDFNEKFGAYVATYNGDEAYKEWQRFLKQSNSLINHFFGSF